MTPQPNAPSYSISDLNLFPTYADRAAYLSATGNQAPPFNPALPIKEWFDLTPSGKPYLVFDTKAGITIELPLPAAISEAVNLPGASTYPAFVETPTAATQNCTFPWVMPTPLDPATLCTQAEAQAEANGVASFFPGKTVTVAQAPYGAFYAFFPTGEARRQWCVLVNGVSPYGAGFNLYAKTLIIQKAAGGVGGPGHLIYAPASGEPVGDNSFQWVQDPQVTVAPPGAMTLPCPIRPLLPDEVFQYNPPPNAAFGSAGGTWVVVRTDIQSAAAQNLAAAEAALKVYNETPGVMQQLELTPVVG